MQRRKFASKAALDLGRAASPAGGQAAAHDAPRPATLGGAITDVPGVQVGHFTDPARPTGCTVILTGDGAVAGVDVRGAAPGTRDPESIGAALYAVSQGAAVVRVHNVDSMVRALRGWQALSV